MTVLLYTKGLTEGDLALGGEHTIQYTDDVLQNCTLETCIILPVSATPLNLIKLKPKEKARGPSKSV